MNRNYFLTRAAIAAVVLMVSCNNGKDVDDNTRVELRLSSGVDVRTRAAFPATDKQIPAGEKVSVYVDETGGGQLYGNNILTADGNGNLSGGTMMYFPASGNVDIYALHTNATLSTAYPTALTHTVSSDQRTLAGYAPSDLLYAKRTNVAKTASPVELTFYHLLSKLQVAIMPGDGLTAADIVGITIDGTKLETQFTLAKSTDPSTFTVTAASTATPASITIGADKSVNLTTDIVFNDAIIVPQTLSSDTKFITVHLSDNTELVYKLPASTTFESGKKYGYLITAHSTGLVLTSIIVDWIPTGNTTGNATME